METLQWALLYVWDLVNEEVFWVGRAVLAGALAAMIGAEREQAGKAAGIRTHMLVGIASCTFASVGTMAALDRGEAPLDSLRAVAAVATGIGFLGGGIIFVTPRRDHVRGLTTAASIWATAAISVTVAFGQYVFATMMAVILYGVLHSINFFPVRRNACPPPEDEAEVYDEAAEK